MGKLNLMSVFVAVAKEGSFTRAAEQLNMSAPSVTRAIASLEEQLGVRLLTRTTRYVRVTDAGKNYFDQVQKILRDIEIADESMLAINNAPQGHLSVVSSLLIGKHLVAPAVIDYLKLFPSVDITISFNDRIGNLIENNIDVAVCVGELMDSSMNAVCVGHVHSVVCASPAYLAEHGTPSIPIELMDHILVHEKGSSSIPEWKFSSNGQAIAMRIYPRLIVSSGDAAIDIVGSGFGITRVQSYIASSLAASREIKIILAEFAGRPMPVNILYREGLHASTKIRTFIDFLRVRLTDKLVLEVDAKN